MDRDALQDDAREEIKDRCVTFNMPDGERLLGCQVHHDQFGEMRAIAWVTTKK
jgi:hypothetical protein